MSHLSKNLARVDAGTCVACGCCLKVCPRQALSVFKGSYAAVSYTHLTLPTICSV